jgi:sulfate transport system permease protein
MTASRATWGRWVLRGVVTGWLGLLVALPVLVLVVRGLAEGPAVAWAAITAPEAVDALTRSLGLAAVTTVLNGFLGTLLAWALARWEFPGRRVIELLVELPLAVPTLVAGILVIALFGPGTPAGRWLLQAGIPIAYAWPGMVLALCFVTLPFVVRAVGPVIAELDPAEEEAARMMGADDRTVLVRILLPPILPAIGVGLVQTFARAVAEFGSLAAVSGNISGRTMSAPVYVLGEVEAGNTTQAAAVSAVLLALALGLQPLASWLARRGSHGQ